MAHRVARRAEADLDDIWYYVAKESTSVGIANRLIDSITSRFFLLASHPHLGRSRDEDFGIGSRGFPVGEYVIVYCVVNEEFSFFAWYTALAISRLCLGVRAGREMKELNHADEEPTASGQLCAASVHRAFGLDHYGSRRRPRRHPHYAVRVGKREARNSPYFRGN